MDARREHYPVHPDEPGCRPVDAGTRRITLGINTDDLLTTPTIARTGVSRTGAHSWVRYFTW